MPLVPVRDGERLFVRVIGRGSPVLMLHGFGTDGRSWLPFALPLLHRHRFILPDLRGFGLSHHVPLRGDCPLTTYAEDVDDILDALHVERTPVVALSMGAFTAVQSFQLTGAPRFSRYMHVDQGPIIKNRDDYAHGMMGDLQPAFFARLEALLSTLDDDHLARPYHALPLAIRREFWRILGDFAVAATHVVPMQKLIRAITDQEFLSHHLLPLARWPVYLQIARAYLERDYDLREGFRAIQVPLTVLIGGASRMYPAPGQHTIAELAPHARVHEIPNVGHNVPHEAPLRFLRELRAFLAI